MRADVGKHVKDIAERYLLPGETQDVALMFVPSESIYADLVEHFDDVVQKAHRARVVIVSPSLMMMAIQVAQAMLRDAAHARQAHAIQAEVGKLLDDARRLAERVASWTAISARRRRTSARSPSRPRKWRAAPPASTRWSSARKRPRSRRRRRPICGSPRAGSRGRRANRRGRPGSSPGIVPANDAFARFEDCARTWPRAGRAPPLRTTHDRLQRAGGPPSGRRNRRACAPPPRPSRRRAWRSGRCAAQAGS